MEIALFGKKFEASSKTIILELLGRLETRLPYAGL